MLFICAAIWGCAFLTFENNKSIEADAASTSTANAVTFTLNYNKYAHKVGGSTATTNVYPVAMSSMSNNPVGNIAATSLSGNTLTMQSSSACLNSQIAYSTFTGSVIVPAREKYEISYNFNCSIRKTAQAGSLVHVGFELLDFGTDPFPTSMTMQGAGLASDATYTKLTKNTDVVGGTISGTYSVTVTYSNDTDTAKTFNSRFGFRASKAYATMYTNSFSASCAMSATVTKVDLLPMGQPQNVTQVFNGNDMLSPLDSVITSASWYYSNRMTLSCPSTVRDAGTYTVTAALSTYAVSENVEWLTDPSTGATTTADQTFTFTITKKVVSYTLANAVTGALVYGTADVGKVEAAYSGIELSDVGTSKGPDLEIYYRSTDSYGYGTGTDDDSGTGLGSLTAPTEAGSYEAVAVDKNALTSNYQMVYGGTSNYRFTILPKDVKAPITLAPLTYSGDAQTFTVNNYDPDLMSYVLPAGMAKGTGVKDFEAVNAGKYEIEYKLSATSGGTVRNYAWDNGTNTPLKVTYEIQPKTLEFKFNPPDGGTSWQIKLSDTGAIGWSYNGAAGAPVTPTASGVREEPKFQYYYYYQADGASTVKVLAEGADLKAEDMNDAAGNRTPGVYIIGLQFAKDSSGADYLVNRNYALGASHESADFELTAGVAGLDGLEINYKKGNDMPLPLAGATLKYELDALSGDPVRYAFLIDFTNLDYMEEDGAYTYEYIDASGNVTPSSTAFADRAGKVRVTVPIRITASKQSSYKMPASYTGSKFTGYTRRGDYTAEITFEYVIGKMEIDTAGFKLQYSFDCTNWKDFTTSACEVEFANASIFVRIDPATLTPSNAGISVMFGTDAYASGRAKNSYSPTANFTLADNDNFTITDRQFPWSITNKQVNVTNWVPGDFIVDGVDRLGEILVINGHKGLFDAGVIEYEYTWSDTQGNGGTGVGNSALSNIFNHASPTNQVTVTATVRLKSGQNATYDISGNLTSQPFLVGAAKTQANINNAGSGEYGGMSAAALGVSVEAGGADLPSVNPNTGAVLYEVYLHDYDGLSVDNISGDGYGEISAIDYSTLNAGYYVVEVRFTAAGVIDYAPRGARSLFQITPKPITVPQTKQDITFNGYYINIADYLDGNYDSSVMSMVSGYTNKTAGTYKATFKLINDNYIWVEPAAVAGAKYSLAKIALTVAGIGIDNTALTATLDWTINKAVLTSDSWDLSGKEGASLGALAAYQSMINEYGLDVALGYRYYDTNGNLIAEPVLKGGDKYLVEAYLTGADAGNFEFADGVDSAKSVTAQQEYTVPKGGLAAAMGSVVSFLKENWLWFVIALAVLLFLIILIVIIAKRRKNKEERLAKKEAKEEEKRRREEEREAEKRRREQELELEKAKQEAELAKMKAQIGLGAGVAGMAAMAAQPQQAPAQAQPQVIQQPYPQMQATPTPWQTPQYTPQQYTSPAHPYPSYGPQPQYPQPQGYDGGANNSRLAQLEMEVAKMKAESDIRTVGIDERAKTAYFAPAQSLMTIRPEYTEERGKKQGMTAELLGEAILSALTKLVENKTPAALPQVTEESKPVSIAYPPDAVVTTTTTVDTSRPKQAERPRRDETGRNEFFDVDGFYDEIDG